MKKRILIVGHGYFGSHLSSTLLVDSFDITATSRTPPKLQPDSQSNLRFIQLDVTSSNGPKIECIFDSIIYCVGFDRTQNFSRHEIYVEGLNNFLARLSRPPKQMIYISSSGVYGQDDGNWVDEDSETRPSRESGQVCLAAEKLLLQSSMPSDVTVLRLAGIYGPNRVPNQAKLETQPVEIPVHGFLNLIHVTDAAQICKRLLTNSNVPNRRRIFNVCDGNPVERRDFYRETAKCAGLQPPVFGDQTTALPHSRIAGNKRISNHRLVTETEYQFVFPSYKEGLKAIFS